jgi:hypothetical protein
VLAIFGNQTDKNMKFTIMTDLTKLGLSVPVSLIDAETGKVIADNMLELPAYDLRMVLITNNANMK